MPRSSRIYKSNFLLFSNKLNTVPSPIFIDGASIGQVDTCKFLGVTVDDGLTFKSHIENVCTKVSRGCGLMYRMSNLVPLSVLKILYSTIIYPHLTYGVEIWGSSARTQLRRLRSLQNRSIKFLRTADSQTIGSVFVNNHLFTLEEIHKLFTLLRFFKYLQDPYFFLFSELQEVQTNHNHNTRFIRNHNLIVSSIRTSSYFNSFIYQGVNYFNELPNEIKELENIVKIKKSLKQHIMSLSSEL